MRWWIEEIIGWVVITEVFIIIAAVLNLGRTTTILFLAIIGEGVYSSVEHGKLEEKLEEIQRGLNLTEEEKRRRWMRIHDPEGYSTMLEIEYGAQQAREKR